MAHPNIKNLQEVEPITNSHGEKFAFTRKRLAAGTGAVEIGASWYEIAPGKQAFPHHAHLANEEAFFVLSGNGEVRIGDEFYPIKPNDYISFPSGPDLSHSIKNTGQAPLCYLGFSTAHPTDVVIYPDSKKFAVAAGANMHNGLKSAAFSKLLREQPSVGYYEGED